MVEKDLTEASEIDRICTIIPGSFSVFAALLVGLSVVLFKKLQTQSFYLVVLQNISEMIFNLSIIGFYHPPVHGNWQCQFQGWLINYGIMSSIFFSGAIAGHMYLTIKVRGYKLTNIRLLYLGIFVVFISTGIAAIPFSTHQYEDLNANCWLAEGEYGTSVTNGIIMRFATHYGLIWATCIFCAFCYVAIVKYVQDIKKQLRSSVLTSNKGPSEMEKTIYRLQYYPAILMFVWSGITLCRLYSSIYPNRGLPIWALCTGHAILNTQGLLNGIVFCSYRSVWFSWAKLFSLDNFVLRLEAGSNDPVRSFGRKSFSKKDRPRSPAAGAEAANITDTTRAISSSISDDSSSAPAASSYPGGSVRGISLQSWVGGAWLPKSLSEKKEMEAEQRAGEHRQVANSSSMLDSESGYAEKEDDEEEVGPSQLSMDLNSADTSFSPLQQHC